MIIKLYVEVADEPGAHVSTVTILRNWCELQGVKTLLFPTKLKSFEEASDLQKALPVLQPWVMRLTLMQQAVLLAGVRGPDGIRKDHIAKLILRWYRRSFILSAFSKKAMENPYVEDGGSFTGPSMHASNLKDWREHMTSLVNDYLKTVDELPHHFQLHLMHGAEILGYKHPDPIIRQWWNETYNKMVNDMHLTPETEEKMDYRLGDREDNWRKCEEVTAAKPTPPPCMNYACVCGAEFMLIADFTDHSNKCPDFANLKAWK